MTENTAKTIDSQDFSSSRIIWTDFARIIAVFAVIVLHVTAKDFQVYGARTLCWQISNVFNSLVRFCVPLFVMISGVFLLDPNREYPIKKLYSKKILRIASAYIFWAAFYSAFALAALTLRGGETFGHGKLYIFIDGIVKGYYHLWFLPMIAGLYIVTPFLRVIAKNEKLTLYFLVLGLIFVYGTSTLCLIPGMSKVIDLTINRLEVKLVAGYSCYFLLGYYLSQRQLTSKARKTIYFAGICGAIFTIAVFFISLVAVFLLDKIPVVKKYII